MTALLLAALLAFGSGPSEEIVGNDGRRLGEIKRDRDGNIEIFDQKSNRIGTGRREPDGSIRVFDPKTFKPLYEIKPAPALDAQTK